MKYPDPQISLVIPVYNEIGNSGPLLDEIEAAMAGRIRYEVIVVDDASSDGTDGELDELSRTHERLTVLTHPHNRGQSAAIHTGVRAARAPVIAVLDGDGQNDPADIMKLFGRLHIGSSIRMVIGERRERHDSWLRKVSSRIANGVRSYFLRDGIRDTGCGLKVFYRDDYLQLPAFDHMHRFMPALIQRHGGEVSTVPVNHRHRLHGVSKYGVNNRLWAGIMDLMGVMWLRHRRL